MIMTPQQVLAVAALGGLAAVLGLVLFAATAVGVFRLVTYLVDRYEDHRARRTDNPPAAAGRASASTHDDLATCRAIDALGTASHPAED